jgi:predicted enzyme related to lactoylglutathione lyase
MKDAITWFELPVLDMDRAQKFYEAMLGTKLKSEVFNGTPHAMFPTDSGVGGALIKDAHRSPAANGSLVYLNANGKLDACLGRVEAAGGKVLLPRTNIGDPGFIALVLDTEGNQVGLHAKPA